MVFNFFLLHLVLLLCDNFMCSGARTNELYLALPIPNLPRIHWHGTHEHCTHTHTYACREHVQRTFAIFSPFYILNTDEFRNSYSISLTQCSCSFEIQVTQFYCMPLLLFFSLDSLSLHSFASLSLYVCIVSAWVLFFSFHFHLLDRCTQYSVWPTYTSSNREKVEYTENISKKKKIKHNTTYNIEIIEKNTRQLQQKEVKKIKMAVNILEGWRRFRSNSVYVAEK